MRSRVDWTAQMMSCMEVVNDAGVVDGLERGADPNAEDRHGRSMLCMAAKLGSERMVSALLRAGASVAATDRHVMTPLALAVSSESLGCVKLLIQAGSSLEAKDDTGRTPFLVAASRRRVEVLEELLAAGSNGKARDLSLNTAMHLCCAAMVRDDETLPLARYLVQFGGLDAKNNWAQTALASAARFGKKKCALLLLDSGASVAASGGLASLLHKASEEEGFKGWFESVVVAREQSKAIISEISLGEMDRGARQSPRL